MGGTREGKAVPPIISTQGGIYVRKGRNLQPIMQTSAQKEYCARKIRGFSKKKMVAPAGVSPDLYTATCHLARASDAK